MVPVGDLSPGLQVPVLFECLGNSVQVDHHLNDVAGVLLAGLRVDDDGLVVPSGDKVGPAGQRCGLAAEFKSVLGLDVDVEAANFPVGNAFVQECGVVQHPLGLVELGTGFWSSSGVEP